LTLHFARCEDRKPMRLLRLATLVALALATGLVAPATGGADTSQCATNGPNICLTTADTPGRASVTTAASHPFIQYQATVTNRDTRNITHLNLKDVTPGGTTVQSVSPSTCTTANGTISCDLRSLASGASVTVMVTVSAPAIAGTIHNGVTASYDEGPSDNGNKDPKTDTLTADESTDVTATPGDAVSWAPPGIKTTISTDATGTNVATPAHPEVAGLTLQAPSSGASAQLDTDQPGPFTCPEHQVCRTGGWIEAHALIGGVPGVFAPPLRFLLRWDASVVVPQQTVRNFAVFYSPNADGSQLQIISRRCSANPPPCLDSVTQESDGDFTAVLVQDHNGRMQ
jgi:hypothetical protein